MRFLKYIIKSAHLLNIFLIIAVVFYARYAVLPVLNTSIKYSLPKSKDIILSEEDKPVINQSPSLSEFMVVADQNLFHPDRIIPAVKITAPPVPPPEIVLYGTLITDNESYAYLEDKKSSYKTPGRGKRQLVLKKGSIIGGYTLTTIEDNKIELIKGENKMVVNLMDSRKPKTREDSANGKSKVKTGIMPAADPMKSSIPQNPESPDVMSSMQITSPFGGQFPMPVPPSASDAGNAGKPGATRYISPRARAKILKMDSNNTIMPAP